MQLYREEVSRPWYEAFVVNGEDPTSKEGKEKIGQNWKRHLERFQKEKVNFVRPGQEINRMTGQLDKLTARERRILEARLLADEPMTVEELAIEFGLARARVKQLEARVIEKLGDSLRGLKNANRQTK